MAAINPNFMTLENHGQNFLLRYQPSFWDSISIFTYWGDHGLVGLSIPKNFEEKFRLVVELLQDRFGIKLIKKLECEVFMLILVG